MSSARPLSPPFATDEMQVVSAMTPCQTMRGHTESIKGVVHLADGRHIITCSWDGSLRRWDLESGTQIGDGWRDEGDDAGVLTIALSPNSKTFASGSEDGTVKLWDVETGKVIARWTEHTQIVESVCCSPNGERVLSGSWDGTVRVWGLGKRENILGPIKTEHQHVFAVAYSPDGSNFATGGFYGVKIWGSPTGNLLSILEYRSTVWCLAWTPDGKKFISGLWNGSLAVFDTATFQQIAVLQGHTIAVTAITSSRNGHILVSTSWDHTSRLCDLETNLQVGPSLQHEKYVRCAAFSGDGTRLVTGCDDANAYMWDLGAILKEHHLEHLLPIPDVLVDEDGKSFLDADAAGPEQEDAHELPQGFLDDTQDHICSSATHQAHLSTRYRLGALASSLASRQNAFFGRILSLLHRPRRNTDKSTENIPRSPITSSTSDSATTRASLRHLANWWHGHAYNAPPPIVDVPFTKGKERNATAGAPKGNGGYTRDEDYVPPPPLPNLNSQQLPVAVLGTTGVHGGGCRCFCW